MPKAWFIDPSIAAMIEAIGSRTPTAEEEDPSGVTPRGENIYPPKIRLRVYICVCFFFKNPKRERIFFGRKMELIMKSCFIPSQTGVEVEIPSCATGFPEAITATTPNIYRVWHRNGRK